MPKRIYYKIEDWAVKYAGWIYLALIVLAAASMSILYTNIRSLQREDRAQIKSNAQAVLYLCGTNKALGDILDLFVTVTGPKSSPKSRSYHARFVADSNLVDRKGPCVQATLKTAPSGTSGHR